MVVVERSAHIVGRLVGEGVVPHQLQDLGLPGQQAVDQRHEPGVVLVVAQRREPHLPVQPRLVGSCQSQHGMWIKQQFWGCTSGGVSVPWIYTHAGWELLQGTQVINQINQSNQSLLFIFVAVFMLHVSFWGCNSGEVHVLWIYMHARWELLQGTQVINQINQSNQSLLFIFVAVFMLHLSFWGCNSGEVHVLWIYSHARWELP